MNSSELVQGSLPGESADSFAGLHFNPHGTDPIRAEVLGLERLETHARWLGQATQQTARVAGFPLLAHFDKSSAGLIESHRRIREEYRPGQFGSDAEWLLDNFHIIGEALAEVRTDLPPSYYALLPKLRGELLPGFPRVYAVAWHLVAHCDSSLDEQHITRFVQAYQDHAPLTIGELWAVPIMLRVVLLDNLRRLASHILRVHGQCRAAAA